MLTGSLQKICKILTAMTQSHKPRLLLTPRWTQMTPEFCMFHGSRKFPMESTPSNAPSASGSYKRRGNILGENTYCQTSELTFACLQTATRVSSRTNLLGKLMMLNVTNVNGVVTNAEVARSPHPRACETIYFRRMRLEDFLRTSLQSWSMLHLIPYLRLLQIARSVTSNTTSEKMQGPKIKICHRVRNF